MNEQRIIAEQSRYNIPAYQHDDVNVLTLFFIKNATPLIASHHGERDVAVQ